MLTVISLEIKTGRKSRSKPFLFEIVQVKEKLHFLIVCLLFKENEHKTTLLNIGFVEMH